MRLFVLSLLMAAFFSSDLNAASSRSILLVCNKSDDTVDFVDTKSSKILGKATTGRGPHEIAVTRDGKWAFVANYEGPGNSLSVIDVKAMKEVRKIPISPYKKPHGIAASRNGRKVYVTCEDSQAVIEIDVATSLVSRTFKTYQGVSHMLVLTPDERKMYVANIGSGNVSVFDVSRPGVPKHIETGAGCEGIDVTPDGKEVWTGNRADDSVTIIDTKADTVLARLPCRGFPIRLKITPDGRRALVSCARSDEVAVFDVARRREIMRIATGAAPIGLLIEKNSRRAYVANTEANEITILNLLNLTAEGKFKAGNTPDGMGIVE